MLRLSCILLLTLMAITAMGQLSCPSLCHCHGDLQHVICYSAGLRKIPKVSDQTKLLNLQKNRFPVLPPGGFSSMTGLVSLHLQECYIRVITKNAFKGLKKLVYLYLSNNAINIIRAGAFDDLGELTYLFLDSNKIADIPKALFAPLQNLFILQLNDNRIKELKPGTFTGAVSLRWLHLSSNEISSIQPGSLDEVENLAIFHLNGNKLSSYPLAAISKLRVVEELKLSHNPIEVIPDEAFQSFGRYLQELYLGNMGIQKFSDNAFSGVTALKAIHIENNKLESLPNNFPYSNLENMTLSDNPWQCTCQLFPLQKWLVSSVVNPEAVCASPSQYRGRQIRDSSVFSSCKLPTKRDGSATKKRKVSPRQ
ncbi:chondroadherin [Protopterus annectens]|uniref:chondroadherin n=1 Tax=Protopterus annectens TaxID=7888 RepID=UPI001CFA3557|nr:chondroadherin [Protopterus annectens]